MAYVVDKRNGEVLDGCDAWDLIGIDAMVSDAVAMGYDDVVFEVTASGNIVIWAN